MRLQALRAAIKKTVSSSTAAAAVTREAAREAAANPHGGGKYSFRQRKAAGALAEPSPGTLSLLYYSFELCANCLCWHLLPTKFQS